MEIGDRVRIRTKSELRDMFGSDWACKLDIGYTESSMGKFGGQTGTITHYSSGIAYRIKLDADQRDSGWWWSDKMIDLYDDADGYEAGIANSVLAFISEVQ